MASFNPIMGGTDSSFLYVVNRPGEDYEAKVVVKNWFVMLDIGTPMEKEMKKINPTVKKFFASTYQMAMKSYTKLLMMVLIGDGMMHQNM